MVAPPPRMSPSLPWCYRLGGKKSCKASLQHVWVATDGVGGVAVVRTLAMEAEVPSRGYEEGFEEISFSQGVDIPGDVEDPASDRDSTSESKNLIKVESGNLGIVTLIISKVEMVGKSLLTTRESHWLEESLSSIFIFYYQFQLCSSLLLRYSNYWQLSHGV